MITEAARRGSCPGVAKPMTMVSGSPSSTTASWTCYAKHDMNCQLEGDQAHPTVDKDGADLLLRVPPVRIEVSGTHSVTAKSVRHAARRQRVHLRRWACGTIVGFTTAATDDTADRVRLREGAHATLEYSSEDVATLRSR